MPDNVLLVDASVLAQMNSIRLLVPGVFNMFSKMLSSWSASFVFSVRPKRKLVSSSTEQIAEVSDKFSRKLVSF